MYPSVLLFKDYHKLNLNQVYQFRTRTYDKVKDIGFIWERGAEWSDWLESDPESYALNGNVRSGLEFLLLLKAEKIELNDAPERKCELF